MAIYPQVGNLLESDCDYICHQVNCMGKMGSGIAKQIREKWPIVYVDYLEKCNKEIPDFLFTGIQIVPIEENKNVINMFSQFGYGYDNKRYTSYDAFWQCLGKIKDAIPKGSKIGFPAYIGCGLGGANWEIIRTMIEEVLSEEYEVYIYIWEGDKNGKK